MYSTEELANDFSKLGIGAADAVMLHASVRAVEEVAGGPDQIHLALKSVLASRGTLMMYASSPRYYDEVGRGDLTMEQEREVREKLPGFDPLTARLARANGTLVSLLTKTRNNGARVGKAMTYMLSARDLLDFALPLMKAVATDPRAAESLKERSGYS